MILLLSGCIIPSVLSEVISIGPVTLAAGTSGTSDITIDTLPNGLSGYRMTVASDNQAVVTVMGATFPSWAALSDATAGEGGSYLLSAIDLNSGVEAGAGGITLATLNLQAVGAGSAQITMSTVQLDDDAGNAVTTVLKPGTISVPGQTPVPTQTPVITHTPAPTTAPFGELTVNLLPGWNLVNIPVQLTPGSNTAEIFKNVQSAGHSILTYDSTAGWITIGKDDVLKPMTGYWIFSTTPVGIPLSGSSLLAGAKTLNAGWNLAGITGTSSKSAESALSGLASWTYVIPFDSSNQQYRDAGIRGNSNAQIMLDPCQAFWIYMNSPETMSPGY